MPRFSIIIPVYNTGKYLKKCLDSVFEQSFNDYEVIVVNDGSTDDSDSVINNHIDKINYIKIDKKKTVGPSFARNLGVSKAKGDYILFLDSDDYYESDLLFYLNNSIDREYDLVRFEIQYDKNGVKEKMLGSTNNEIFSDGLSAFNKICNYSIVESPCCYAFNRKYFLKNKFKFMEDTLHEDFGLIPLVIINSKSVKCLKYIGYNYVLHENSIMSSNSYDKVLKKCNDFLFHFKKLKDESSKFSGDLSIFNSYIANSVILKSTFLKGKDYKKYVEELRRLGVFNMLLSDTFGRKIKKIFVCISPRIYYKLVRR